MIKFIDRKPDKEMVLKLLAVLIIISIALLTVDVMNTGSDGRRQIVDEDGGEEVALCAILSDIKGAGVVDAMIKYDADNNVSGVIVTSTGAGNPTVRNNLTNAVAALYDISVFNVMVFEKESSEK